MTVAARNLQSIAKSRAAHDKRKRVVIGDLLSPQIAIDCKFPESLSNVTHEKHYEALMNKSDIE